MSNQPFRRGAFEIPCRAGEPFAPPARRRPLDVIATSRLRSLVVLAVGLLATLRGWARMPPAWFDVVRVRWRTWLDRGFEGSPSPSGKARA
jgi:hypothetical protein